MRLMLKLLCLPIVTSAMACASAGPPVTLTLGPIICPASLLLEEPQIPNEISAALLAKLPKEDSDLLVQRDAQWEAAVDEALSRGDDALEACGDYNQRLRELNETPR